MQTVDLTVKQIVGSYSAINNEILDRKGLGGDVLHNVIRLTKALNTEVETYQKTTSDIFNRYPHEMDKDNNKRVVKESISEYDNEIDKILKVTVSIPFTRRLTIPELGAPTPSPRCLIELDWLIYVDEQEPENS